MSVVRRKLDATQLPAPTKNIILASYSEGTVKQYRSYLSRWEKFCESNNLHIFHPGLEDAIEFLTEVFNSGVGYSAVNTARSALSSIIILPDGLTFGEHPLVHQFLKGVFELKPSLPKYKEIWDVAIVLNHLKTSSTHMDLTTKLSTLLCLLSGQRCQTVHKLDIDFIQEFDGNYLITVREKLKQTRPGKHLELLEFYKV